MQLGSTLLPLAVFSLFLASPVSGGETEITDASAGSFAPVVNQESSTDYIAWARKHLVMPEERNAYSAYAGLIAELDAVDVDERFVNLHTDRGYEDGIKPWDPEEHPQWEKSYQATLDWVERYARAARDKRPYATPLGVDEKGGDKSPLPFLMPPVPGDAMRHLCRQATANGWRVRDGAVPPKQLLDSWEIVLGNARHLNNDYVLRGRLVGSMLPVLVYESACAALEHEIINAEAELDAALQTLRAYDLPRASATNWVRGEHMIFMRQIQQMLEMLGSRDGDNASAGRGGRAFMAAASQADQYYRRLGELWRGGFTAENVEALRKLQKEARSWNTAMLKTLMPSIERACVLMMRSETSHRAAQLVYAVHLFKAWNERLPESLSDVKELVNADATVDPFSGEAFVYRTVKAGFTVYSVEVNGKDDGGRHNPDGRMPEVKGDDRVYWPVPH